MRLPVVPVLVMCTLVSAVTTAQTDSPPQQTKDFATAKAERVTRLQTELACVQASTSFETMRACMPHPPGGRMMMGSPPDQK
jgi:hypothetical protein